MGSPVIRCITGAQKCSSVVMLVCEGISIVLIATCVMKFGSVLLGGVHYVGVELSMVFLLLVLIRFDHLSGRM